MGKVLNEETILRKFQNEYNKGKRSTAEIVASFSEVERKIFFEATGLDTPEAFSALEYDSSFWLRPKQKVPTTGDWFITALVAGRGFGKLCDVNHKLPTPNGWKRLGDIVDGDQVFDEYGRPCTVIQAHPIQLPKKAYKLTFSDGHTIVAGEEHLWTTWTHRDRKSYNRRNEYVDNDQSVGLPDNWPEWTKPTRWGTPSDIGPKVRTTQEIVDSFRYGKRGDLNHSIPVLANPLQYTEKVLPIDPYVYGAWLGDGSSSGPTMTSHVDESDWLINMFESRGYPLMSKRRAINSETRLDKNCNSISFYNLSSDLKYAQVLGNKNIIEDYRYGSEQQRRDVLAGLLDTDGFIDSRTHYIEFCSKREDHAKFVEELALSLGQKPKVYTGEATLNGKTFGTKYRVCWRPTENFFYMPRKAREFVPMGGQASRNMHRMIVDFEEVPVVPMRCLSVDSPNNLFLIGEGMIPTHNTLTMTEWVRKFVKENPGCRLAIAGRTAGDIRNTMVTGEALALDTRVPTPDGWTTMGDLKVGDTVYSGDGKPCKVTKAYPVLHGRECYTVNISGTEVVADANHKWLTWDFKSRVSISEGRLRTKFKKSVVTTKDIRDTLKYRNQSNHGILNTKIEGTQTELPVDPYILGYWLGDGTSKSSDITVHDEDRDNLWDSVMRAGYVPTNRRTKYTVGVTKGFYKDLGANNLLRNKHIPEVYLRSTYENRLQLVRGLMDSDGHVDTRSGAMEFSNKNPRIVRGMYELLSSLGIRVRECAPNSDGQMRLSFTTSVPVFQLKRKLDRVREYRREDDWRYVFSVEPTETVPVRCIEVDSDDHTFLITDSFIRTHNSGILAKSPPAERPEYKKMESMLVWPNGSTAQLLSSEVPDAARGPQYHATLADEFAAWKTTPDASGATLFDNLVLATRLGKNPKMLLATTPKRTKVMKDVMEWSKDPERKVNIVTGSTYENATLSKDYLRNIENQYGDSDLAKQELEGLMLEDAEGIVFTDAMLDNASSVDKVPNNLIKIIAVDPTVAGDPKNADECGIMVIGATRESDYRHRTAYVLEDATVTAKPEDWAKVVADTARKWGIRNVVVETNQGGDLLRNIIQSNDNGLIVHNVTATKGKVKRVEPVAIKMQQGKVFFSPKDDFLQLKDQLTFYDPDISGYSPDRMDAFAWGVTALLIDPPKTLRFGTFQAHRAKGSMPRRMNTGRSVRRYGNRSPRR